MKIENWKLKQIAGHFDIISEKSAEYIDYILKEKSFPLVDDYTIYRSQTQIDWPKMSSYYRFFIDDKDEGVVKNKFETSLLRNSRNVIITYGWKEPVIKISLDLFLLDWEGFIRSKLWEGFIFSEDFKLVIECTRDYNIHSNFQIFPNSVVSI